MEQIPLQSPNVKSPEIIKLLPSLAIGISSICFISGLLIVNLYLANFGIYSYEFIRTEYILAGAVFAFLVGMAGVGLHFCSLAIRKVFRAFRTKNRRTKALLILLIAFTLVLVAEITAIRLLSLNHFPLNKRESWIGFVGLFLTSLTLAANYKGLVAYLQLGSAPGKISLPDSWKPKAKPRLFAVLSNPPPMLFVMNLLLLLTWIGLYTITVYPYIQGSYGGGKKNNAYLLPTVRGVEICKSLSLPFNKELVGPLEVLTETDKEVVVLIPNELSTNKIAVRLSKINFDAVQTIPSRPKQ